MNFYSYADDSTVIKSINYTLQGCKFNRKLSEFDLEKVWNIIKLNKRISTILIFLCFITLMYGVIFPNFTHFVNNNWFVNSTTIIIILFGICSLITFFTAKIFEKQLQKNFGEYEKTIFKSSNNIDMKYYNIFKFELAKAGIFLIVLILLISLASPLKRAQNAIVHENYSKTIRLTTIGSIVFPILPDWYSLRGYAKFQEKDFNGAISDFDRAYALGSDEFNPMNFDNKIFIKYFIKDYTGALKDFDNEISNAPDDYQRDAFMWDKAQFLYNISKYQEALDIYTELLAKADNDSVFLLKDRLYLERAQVYQVIGKEQEAKKDLFNAGALDLIGTKVESIPSPVLLLDEI